MPTRLRSIRTPPLGFAHRGARAHAPENTIEAFLLALRLGATGLESDVWLTADGEAVLDHDGVVGRLRRRPVARSARDDLPAHVPTLAQLYEACGTGADLSLDVKDVAAFPRVVEVARAAGGEALGRLWLCHPDLEVLQGWRAIEPEVHLVDSTRLRHLHEGLERRAATLAGARIDALNLHHSDWTGGRVALVHRFEVLAFGWDAQQPRILAELLDCGIDAVYSDHVDRMADALARAAAPDGS
ncbi:MAG: glycerophosphodiester phosphodiesterase [Acidimicrobiia bacterium]